MGTKVRAFCYPYGTHPPALVDAVRAAGFRAAFVCEDRVAIFRRDMDLLRIPRVSVYGGTHRFHIERAEPEAAEGGVVVFVGCNDGVPVPVWPVLVAGRRRVPLGEPPTERLGSEPQRWCWPRAQLPLDVQDDAALRLELWDHHRILRLYP